MRRCAAAGAVVVAVACSGSTQHAHRPRRARIVPSSSTTTTTTTVPTMRYEVQRGDTLTSIARRFGVSPAALAFANGLRNADRVELGQVLVIPAHPLAQLMVVPQSGPPGQAFSFRLTGAHPGEAVTFAVSGPSGQPFSGAPHNVGTDGSVMASYQTKTGDPPGAYTVVASGNQGTAAQATFRVESTPSST